MNEMLPITIDKKRITRILLLVFSLFCILPTILNITVVTPIYFSLEHDIVYSGTAITLTLKYVADLLDVLSFSSVYALLTFTLLLLEKKHTVFVSLCYVAVLILKIPVRILMNIPLYGSIGTEAELIADLMSLSFYFILELLQFLIVLLIASVISKNYLRSLELLKTSKRKQSKQPEFILPISKFINWYNPLLRISVYSGITVVLFRVLSRVVTDIGAGAPTMVGEVLIMIVYYLSDVIYGIAAYLIAILVFNILYDMIKKWAVLTPESKKNKANEKDSSALFED